MGKWVFRLLSVPWGSFGSGLFIPAFAMVFPFPRLTAAPSKSFPRTVPPRQALSDAFLTGCFYYESNPQPVCIPTEGLKSEERAIPNSVSKSSSLLFTLFKKISSSFAARSKNRNPPPMTNRCDESRRGVGILGRETDCGPQGRKGYDLPRKRGYGRSSQSRRNFRVWARRTISGQKRGDAMKAMTSPFAL